MKLTVFQLAHTKNHSILSPWAALRHAFTPKTGFIHLLLPLLLLAPWEDNFSIPSWLRLHRYAFQLSSLSVYKATLRSALNPAKRSCQRPSHPSPTLFLRRSPGENITYAGIGSSPSSISDSGDSSGNFIYEWRQSFPSKPIPGKRSHAGEKKGERFTTD